jgi:hypothetical protein
MAERLLFDQRSQVRLQAGTIFCRGREKDIDELAFARSEVSADASARKAMQQGDRLSEEQLL